MLIDWISNLDPMVQALFFDRRPNQNGQHIFVDGQDMGRFGNGPKGGGLLVTGTFVAKAATQTFKLQRTDRDSGILADQVQLNALAVHQVP